jgi:phage terminase small subunit
MPRTRTPLTERQRRFVQRYLVHGNATRAAKEAGYAQPNKLGAVLVKQGAVAAAIKAAQVKTTSANIIERDEALLVASRIIRTDDDSRSVIAAIAQVSKMQSWEAPKRLEHTGPDGTPIQLQSVPATNEQALEALEAHAKKDPALAAQLKKLGSG